MSESESEESPYTPNDYFHLIQPLFKFSQHCTSRFSTHKILRTLLDFSLARGLRLKNSQRREIELGDLQVWDSIEDGLIIHHGRRREDDNDDPTTDYYSRKKRPKIDFPYRRETEDYMLNEQKMLSACFRSVYVEFCPILALALYLFSRFHIPDEYDSLEFLESSDKSNLEPIKLLKGSNKLVSISYSQQHKTSIIAVSISGFNSKEINLGRILSTQICETNEKPHGKEEKDLNAEEIFKMARGEKDAPLKRSEITPPLELLNQIFPFVNEPLADNMKGSETLIKVFRTLRVVLLQDMVIIRRKYPENAVSTHPIFNSDLFNQYARKVEENGVDKDFQVEESEVSGHVRNENLESTHVAIKLIENFLATQSRICATQVHELSQMNQNSSGMSILMTMDPKTALPLIQSKMRESEHIYSRFKASVDETIKTTESTLAELRRLMGLEAKDMKKEEQLFSQPSIKPPDPFPPQPLVPTPAPPQTSAASAATAATTSTPVFGQRQPYFPPSTPATTMKPFYGPPNFPNQQMYPYNYSQQQPVVPMYPNYPPVYPGQMGTLPPQPGFQQPVPTAELTPQQKKRQAVLNRRLSRQATTLYEMWDDFKDLEKELRFHEITVTEWLKIHGSSERQFRHTRLKIIKFVEDEAFRRNCDVEVVKELLHKKMRNRQRPCTLDEVQRMLTSGKRINLDE